MGAEPEEEWREEQRAKSVRVENYYVLEAMAWLTCACLRNRSDAVTFVHAFMELKLVLFMALWGMD